MSVAATWRVRLDIGHFTEVEPEIAAFLAANDVYGKAAYVSQLVVEEIVRNLIEHTPPYAQHEVVTVEVTIAPSAVTVVIEDARPSFAPAAGPAFRLDAPLDERRAGGMGLHLVRSLTDELRYDQTADGNRLTAIVKR